MDTNFPTIAYGTSLREGLYSIVRSDDGNWTGGQVGVGTLAGTMRGISAATMAHWLGPGTVTAATMKAIDQPTFTAIARALFWRPLNASLLPSGLDLIAFDFGFNAGVATAARMLQGLVGVARDGDIGPRTLAAIEADLSLSQGSAGALIDKFAEAQRNYYRALRKFPIFGDGWLARVDWRLHAGLALARGETKIPLA